MVGLGKIQAIDKQPCLFKSEIVSNPTWPNRLCHSSKEALLLLTEAIRA